MAKQTGAYVFVGTVSGLCFYCMNGSYYVRTSNRLSRKRVLTDAAFAGTRRYAQWLADASPIASAIYRILPPEKRQKGLYRILTGKTLLLLKSGVEKADVSALLLMELETAAAAPAEKVAEPQPGKKAKQTNAGKPVPQWPGLTGIMNNRAGSIQRRRTRLRRRWPVQSAKPETLINSISTRGYRFLQVATGIFDKTLLSDERIFWEASG
jgi:hypothetical protein